LSPKHVEYRPASSSDAAGIAKLHAESWRKYYRGAYSDRFLDHSVTSDRLAVWTQQTREKQADEYTLVAESDERIMGFAHTILGDDPKWGALLENLHVASVMQRSGIGTQLMVGTADAIVERAPSRGLYLWVLEQNAAAQAFYHSFGGACVERSLAPAPGGDPSRLSGNPYRMRYVWPDPNVLLERFHARPRRQAHLPRR
jgi:ribosomal protein S18 acetylase RimI-like enzyme